MCSAPHRRADQLPTFRAGPAQYSNSRVLAVEVARLAQASVPKRSSSSSVQRARTRTVTMATAHRTGWVYFWTVLAISLVPPRLEVRTRLRQATLAALCTNYRAR